MLSSDESIVASKLIGMAVFSSSSIIFGLIPMFVHLHYKRRNRSSGSPDGQLQANEKTQRRKKRYKYLLSEMSAFSGGVLLSTTFLHLLPEIRKSIDNLREKDVIPKIETIQLAEFLMCLGFLFLYLIEEIAHKIVYSKRGCIDRCESDHAHFVDNKDRSTNGIDLTPNPSSAFTDSNTAGEEVTIDVNENRPRSQSTDRQKSKDSRRDQNMSCKTETAMFFNRGAGKNFLLIFALSIHEGFEGLAIGLESKPDAIWAMIIGVGAHKTIIALCIGIQMVSTKMDRKLTIIYVFVFATATSFGVLIGLCLYTESGLFSIILQGLATGTLLHVVFFELLKPHSENTPFFGLFLGFMSMAVLKYYSPS